MLDEEALYQYFTQPLRAEECDNYSRKKPKISTPKPIKSLYKLFGYCTPEQKYFSALRLLQGWDEKTLNKDPDKEMMESNALKFMEKNNKTDFKKFCDRVVSEAVKETMEKLYSNYDKEITKKLESTLTENFNKLLREKLISTMEKDFMEQEAICNITSFQDIEEIPVNYNLISESHVKPSLNKLGTEILLPLQENIAINPQST